MNQADLQALSDLIVKALHNEENFGKVWGVLGPFISGILVGLFALGGQIYTSYKQRRHEKENAIESAEDETNRAQNELKMWNIASQRKATSKVAKMRQVWINNLRKDLSNYLTLQREIMYRWDAIRGKMASRDFNEAQKIELFRQFQLDLPGLRKDALQLKLQITLCLNPNENNSKKILAQMENLEKIQMQYSLTDSEIPTSQTGIQFNACFTEIINISGKILATEWRVVKRELGVQSENDNL